MSSDFPFDDDFDETFTEEEGKAFIVIDSIVFLIDGSEQMFEKNFFTECLEMYRNIIRKKCARNKKDKVGLVLYGTKESNCEVDNLMVLQKFETVTVDSLKNINNILKENAAKYREMTSSSNHSLHNALFYAYQMIESFQTNSKKRSIIFLCTCNDNPCHDKPDERRRIEHLVATFKYSGTKLWVAGLSNSWKDELYYRDLQIISGTFNNDDYKRININDIEQSIVNPSRTISQLIWKISSQIAIQVNLINLISTPMYPSKVKLEKEDDVILEGRRVVNECIDNDNESADLMEEEKEKKIIRDENLLYYKTFGNTDISFKPTEYKKFKNMGLKPGFEILAFKPISCDPMHHDKFAYFVTYNEYATYESKMFFMAFVSRCAEKKVMAICKAVTTTNIFICTMIPSEDDGGFYMYKIPFSDKVRDFDNLLQSFIYNSENSCGINNKAVDIYKKLIDIFKQDFDIKKFTNPKLEKCIAHIEALALDEKLGELPPDRTLPPAIVGNVQELKAELISLLNLEEAGSKKRPTSKAGQTANKKAKLDIVALAKEKMLHKATVADLKAYLDSVNQRYTGTTKSGLINIVNKYLGM